MLATLAILLYISVHTILYQHSFKFIGIIDALLDKAAKFDFSKKYEIHSMQFANIAHMRHINSLKISTKTKREVFNEEINGGVFQNIMPLIHFQKNRMLANSYNNITNASSTKMLKSQN